MGGISSYASRSTRVEKNTVHTKFLQLHDEKLQVKTQLAAHLFRGPPAACEELDLWWMVEPWGGPQPKKKLCTVFFSTRVTPCFLWPRSPISAANVDLESPRSR